MAPESSWQSGDIGRSGSQAVTLPGVEGEEDTRRIKQHERQTPSQETLRERLPCPAGHHCARYAEPALALIDSILKLAVFGRQHKTWLHTNGVGHNHEPPEPRLNNLTRWQWSSHPCYFQIYNAKYYVDVRRITQTTLPPSRACENFENVLPSRAAFEFQAVVRCIAA